MKAFSFQTILKNFGKQLFSLASQMPWCNLRFNLGSMSVLSRVNPLFSRRTSHFAAMIFAVLAMSIANIGTAWGDTELFSTDFKNDWTNTTLVTNGDITTTTPTYPAEMYFRASGNDKTVTITDNGVTQCSNLIVNNYISGVKLTGINGSITITLTHTYSSKKPTFRYYFVDGATAFSSSVSASYSTSTSPSSNGEPAVITISGIKNTSGVFYFGAASSSYYSIASITVTTPTPCPAANLTASNITSNGDQEAGTGITFSKVGTPASGDTWYWQTSATGTDTTYSASSSYTTATTAGSYTVYLRAYNSASDCWGTAASMTNTIYPAPSAMIHNTFAVDAAWSSTIATQDKANITNLNAMAAVGQSVGSDSNKDGLTQKIPSQSSEDPSKYMSLSFSVATGKQLNVTSVVFDEQPVTGTGTFKVSISDDQGSTTKTQTIASGSAGEKHTLTLDDDIVGSFKGTVTVKVWAYGWKDGYRFGDYFYVNGTIEEALPSCTAPTSVVVTPTNEFGWRYSIGETISLTATATGGSGNYTYQWQKYIGDTWTDIAGATAATYTKTNCTTGDGGSYRCVVSTGTNCSRESEGYFVRVFTLNGGYTTDGEWTAHKIDWTDENTGVVTISLPVSETYYFKVTDNDGKWFGYGDASNYIIQPWQADCGTGNSNIRLFTGPAGDYKFTINIEHAQENSPYVNIKVDYPEVTHPVEGYAYINKWWDCYVHYWEGASNALTAWGSDPKINSDRYVNICGTDYWYFPVIETYTNFIAKDNAGNPANTTGDQSTTNHSGQNITHNGIAWVWQEFSTYSITFNGNGNTGGSMTNVTGITCGGSATLTQNAFTRTGYTFAGWATTADGDVAHADNATISNITSDITLYAKWNAETYSITYNGLEGAMHSNPDTYTIESETITFTDPSERTGYTFAGWDPTSIEQGSTGNKTVTATWTTKTTTITINANTANHGSTAPSPITATYGSALPSFTAATGASVYSLTGYFTAATSGTKVINADGTLVASTDYADGTGKWKYETSTLTLYPQYEEEAPAPAGDCGEIIKSTFGGTKNTSSTPSTTTFNTTGEIGGTSTSARIGDNGKLNNEGAYLILKLSIGTFLAGDTIKISSDKSGGVKFATGTVSTQTYTLIGTASTATSGGQPYYFVLAANADSIIVPRGASGSDYNQNPKISYVSVHRPCPECDATPAAPTAFSAGSITSTGATFTITDAGDAASYDIYYSESSTAPTAGTAATTTSTEKTKAVTDLTASTTYYAWVRSVCDASHKSDWVALGTTSFTTAAAEPEALIHWTMNLNTATWGAASTTTTDVTNITSIATSRTNGATGSSASATAKVKMASAEVSDASNPSDYAAFTFTINAAKKVEPERVTCEVFNVSTGSRTYKAQISDSNGHVYNSTNTVAVSTEATLTPATFTFASDLVLTGNVTVKVYAWKTSGSPTDFRMGADVKLFGEVQNAADYTVTHTLSNVTKSSGATSVKEGNTYTATYAASSGYTLPSTITVTIGGASKTVDTDYTWNSETGVVTIPGNKVTGNIVITVTGVVAATYALNYECNGAESGCPSNTTASALPNPLPTGLTKDGYTFGGWYTDEDLTVAAVAGAALTANTTLYAKWTVNSSSECITIAYFDASQGSSSNNKPDANAKYLFGYTNSAKTSEYAYTLTTGSTNNKGQGTGASDYLRMDYGTTVTVYADNTTTGGTPASFENVTGVSVDFKMKNSSYYTSFDIYVGDTKIADDVSLSGDAQTAFTTFAYEGLAQLSGTVRIVNKGNGSSNYHFYVDNIEICTSSLDACTTPVLSDLEDQKVCPGEDVSWTAIVNNTEDLQDGEIFAYQWNKKGNSTVLSSDATLTLDNVTEAAGGTYVVTAIVSAEGKASATATKEVTLTVTPATATPTITANANTIYTGNSVTLTATCASSEVTYKWYTCTDAEGTNAQAIGGAENAEYTLTAGEAGTYYYKVIVTGDGTHSCGTAEKVYALVVSAAIDASDCTTYFWFPYAEDATTTNKVTNNENNFFGNSPKTGSSNSGTYNFELDDKTYTATKNTGSAQFTISFTVPENSIGTMAINCKGSSKPLYLKHTDDTQILVSDNSSYESFVIENITPGTWTLQSSGSWTLSGMAVKVCSGSTCTDPQVTATVDNATICAGTESTVTFTATNYAVGAEFLWQKKDGNTWENIDATSSDTYTISSVTTEHAGQYRVIATKECSRTSEELTLTVLTAPEFNAFANTASVMKGNALTINDVEATNATSYTWYKSTDATYDAGTDTKVGTSKELLLAAGGEAAGATYYLFCVASNSCGSTTSGAITVNVTALVEEECATKGNEGEHEFGFVNKDCSEDTYGDSKTPVWKTSSRSKYLTYTAPEGKYFATAKVTVAHSEKTKCGYAYSTDGGTTWAFAELEGLSATLTAITIELPANVNTFRISRNLQDGDEKDWGVTSGTFYLAEACFTYENACTPTSVTPTTTSFEYNISTQMDFVEPTFTVKHGEEVVNDAVLTYTSSNPAIATVDEDGSVTFEGMTGTVTITAAYAGTTIDEIEYCASEGSYTITVGCQDQEPKIIAAAGTNLDGCNNSITLEAKMQDGNSFTGGTYQWYRDGEAIEGATSASYEVVRAGTYTVSRTDACTKMSSNSAVVTNENPEPKVERLTPFQYYHVDKDYSNQMKDRHLFAVTSYGTLDGKRYHLTATRNGEAPDLSSLTAFFTIPSSDNAVDTVMIDLNELKGKYSANDEIVITCAPINNCNQVSTITSSITIHVIDQTPTLALICSGANGDGTRDTEKLVVGGDFLTGYNKADLCQQTGNKTFDPNTEWGFYEALQDSFIVTPVNGYAQFNKLNYEPFDILLLTDYPKSSKSEAAQKIIDDMAELCDYRPLLSFKTHFQSDKWKDKTTGEYKYTKWVKKGFTTAPVVPKQTATYVNIVCYAHPMFEDIDDINDQYTFHDHDDPNQLVYQVLTRPGYESSKGIQGFELADADNFVTIGLVHYNAIADSVTHDGHTHISWNAEANDRLLVAMAERQTNIEARMMLFSLNCGAQSLQTPGGRNVILKCLEYLLETDPLKVADCRFTFDNGAGNTDFDPEKYEGTGVKGDSLWSTAANWGPDYIVVPGRNNDVRIAAPCIVDGVKTKISVGDEVQETIQYYPEVLSIHITENGSLTIPANSSLTARSTILRADENGNVYPTNVADISLGSNADGNASLILNNERGDTKAGVAMYSKAKAGTGTTWQYIGTPHTDVQNATYNYYDSWLYQYDTNTQSWVVVPTGGAVEPWVGYCITHPEQGHTYWMEGTLAATTNQDITIPAKKFVVVANSWTAPIQINELTDDDMEGLTDKTIYFFNTGSDPEGDNDTIENATGDERWAEGTYIPVPIHAADYTGEDTAIPSMQGFYVVGGNEADGTLHLDYERHVRAPRTNTPSGPMHAPARITDTDNEPQVAKFLFRGKRYDDRLIILERPDFTRGYDSGWDGEQWGGNAAAPMSYVVADTRYDAVSAIPEYEGTVIGFRAGEDNIYTIHFDYDGMEEALYLLDTETKIYTRVLKGNSYTFACPDKAEHNRFILTRKAPQIATGTENIATGENAKAVKFIKDDKIFIFVNGILYDATGKMVIR